MKRKIYDDLLNWKNTSRGTSALLIEGARRVGKSYIVEVHLTLSNGKDYILYHQNRGWMLTPFINIVPNIYDL